MAAAPGALLNSEYPVQCFIVSAPGQDPERGAAAELAAASGYAVTLLPDLAAVSMRTGATQTTRSLVILLDASAAGDLAEDAIRFAAEQAGAFYLLYVAETIAPVVYKRLLRTHAAEWCRTEGLGNELVESARRLAGSEAIARSGGARIVSFMPSKGGVGNTTLAIEAAMHLSARGKRGGIRIALLDLDLDGGTLADALDLQPRFDIREIMGRPERLDHQLIDVFTSRQSENVDVFASPPRAAGAVEIDPAMVFSVLDLLAERYDLVLIDLPYRPLPFVDNLLQGSDAVVLSGIGTVPGLRRLALGLSHLEGLGLARDKVSVAVNQCETDLLGRPLRRREIARALPGRALLPVRDDAAAVREAANAGRPLSELHPGCRASKDMRRIADWIETTVGIESAARSARP